MLFRFNSNANLEYIISAEQLFPIDDQSPFKVSFVFFPGVWNKSRCRVVAR